MADFYLKANTYFHGCTYVPTDIQTNKSSQKAPFLKSRSCTRVSTILLLLLHVKHKSQIYGNSWRNDGTQSKFPISQTGRAESSFDDQRLFKNGLNIGTAGTDGGEGAEVPRPVNKVLVDNAEWYLTPSVPVLVWTWEFLTYIIFSKFEICVPFWTGYQIDSSLCFLFFFSSALIVLSTLLRKHSRMGLFFSNQHYLYPSTICKCYYCNRVFYCCLGQNGDFGGFLKAYRRANELEEFLTH